MVMEIRRDLPEQVDVAHEHDQERDQHQLARLPFQVAGKQQRKGQYKVQANQCNHDDLPMSFDSIQVPANLFHDVARPDDQPLGKREVSPKDDEGQHQLAKVVKIIDFEHARERLARSQPGQQKDGESKCAKTLAHHEQHAKNRGPPLRRQRHDPIYRSKGNGESIENNACAA